MITVLKIFKFADTVGTDKVLHLTACYFVTLLTTVLCSHFMEGGNAMAVGFLVVLAVGVGKELYDLLIRKTCFDSIDFAFDTIGIAFAELGMLVFL